MDRTDRLEPTHRASQIAFALIAVFMLFGLVDLLNLAGDVLVTQTIDPPLEPPPFIPESEAIGRLGLGQLVTLAIEAVSATTWRKLFSLVMVLAVLIKAGLIAWAIGPVRMTHPGRWLFLALLGLIGHVATVTGSTVFTAHLAQQGVNQTIEFTISQTVSGIVGTVLWWVVLAFFAIKLFRRVRADGRR